MQKQTACEQFRFDYVFFFVFHSHRVIECEYECWPEIMEIHFTRGLFSIRLDFICFLFISSHFWPWILKPLGLYASGGTRAFILFARARAWTQLFSSLDGYEIRLHTNIIQLFMFNSLAIFYFFCSALLSIACFLPYRRFLQLNLTSNDHGDGDVACLCMRAYVWICRLAARLVYIYAMTIQ